MIRGHLEPLPKTGIVGILQFVRRALAQTKVQKVEISKRGIEVVREMPDDESPIVPDGTDDIDVGYLLGSIELASYAFNPKEHPLYALHGATQAVLAKDRDVHAIVTPGWPMMAAWLGVETPTAPPRSIFGTKLVYVQSGITNDRVIVLGSKPNSIFLSDVDFGVAVDIGV